MHGAAPGLLIFGQFCTLATISFVYARWKEGGGRVLLAWSLISGEDSAAVPVSQMSFVFTFLLAAPLFGEAVTTRKLTGLGAAVLAILAFDR